jgi:hypothetical protein
MIRRLRDVLTPEQLAAAGKTGDEVFTGADDKPEDHPTPEERYQEGDLTWRQYNECRAALDHFKTLPAERRRQGVAHEEMRSEPGFRERLAVYMRFSGPRVSARPRGAGRPRGRPKAQRRASSRGGDPGGDDPPPEPELRGRVRYGRDLQRLINRFGTLERAYAWLRERRVRRPEPPPSDYWSDEP